jgi:hypothetical protein
MKGEAAVLEGVQHLVWMSLARPGRIAAAGQAAGSAAGLAAKERVDPGEGSTARNAVDLDEALVDEAPAEGSSVALEADGNGYSRPAM